MSHDDAEAVTQLAAACSAPGIVVDLGGGPGWYAARLLQELEERAAITLDASVPAASYTQLAVYKRQGRRCIHPPPARP